MFYVSFFTLVVLISLLSPEGSCMSLTRGKLSGLPTLALEERGLVGESAEVITACKKGGTFALTYDDGPFTYNNQILSSLSKHGAKATFFVNGVNFGCIYDEKNVADLKHAFAQGHAIGSHTWSHANISNISEEELLSELTLLETALKKILGIKTKLFRPPYGELNEPSKRVLQKKGYSIVTWSLDSGDSVGATPEQSIALYKQAAKQYPDPQIILSHETMQLTASTVTPKGIDILKDAGYRLVTVPECLEWDEYYTVVGAPQARDASWTCEV